jgi:hypothetical protein
MPRKFRAKNVIDYVSTSTGEDKHVEPGDVFDDMNSIGVRFELEADNIEEAEEGDGK